MSETTTEKQHNEHGPVVMSERAKQPKCFVCKALIVAGESCYFIPVEYRLYRHVGCARKPKAEPDRVDCLKPSNYRKPLPE